MFFSSSQKFLIIILGLAAISGGATLGYKISQEYPAFKPPAAAPSAAPELAPAAPVMVTEKAPIEKLAKRDKEKLQKALKININTAPSDELQKIPYVGSKKAERIIAGRPYEKIEDIMKVPGFGEKTLEKIKDYVTVSGKGLGDYKPPAERAKALADGKKITIIKVDTDGDGIPDTFVTKGQ